MNEWQKLEYDILCKVVDICEKHNIVYYLSSGTLLGAVRHKGFIPWDDDVDLSMSAKEYKKFCRIPQKEFEEKGLFLQTHHTEKKYNSMWAHVRANETTSMPISLAKWDIHWGACIDIFPLIGLYDNIFLRKIQNKLFNYNLALLDIDLHRDINEPLNRIESLFALLPRKVRHLLVDINNIYIDRDFTRTKKAAAKWVHIYSNRCGEYAKETIQLQFEDRMFNAPYRYDEALKLMYGDYMTPPPENERGGHELSQGDSIFDCHKDYKEYKAELFNKE